MVSVMVEGLAHIVSGVCNICIFKHFVVEFGFDQWRKKKNYVLLCTLLSLNGADGICDPMLSINVNKLPANPDTIPCAPCTLVAGFAFFSA